MTETSYWHPFAQMSAVKNDTVTIVRGEGRTVWDSDGNSYLDSLAGLWYCNVGLGRKEIADVARQQSIDLAAFQTFDVFTTPNTELFAARIADYLPFPDGKIFFTAGGGSEAVDTAAKLARLYWSVVEQPSKQIIISRTRCYHGMNAYGTSLAGLPANLAGLSPLIESVAQVPWNDAESLRTKIAELGAENVAAFFCEPIVGAGGVLHPPEGYLAEVQKICRENNVLLIIDEVVSAFGRGGAWFSAGRYGLQPDMITMAKGLTSGYAPLGAVAIASRISEVFWKDGSTAVFRHGYTYSGHAMATAVGNANLDILEKESLVDRVVEYESVMAAHLKPLADHRMVDEVRAGVGLLGAVNIDERVRDANPGVLGRLVREARNRGVITRNLGDVSLQVSPAFTITDEELAKVAEVIHASLEVVSSEPEFRWP
jgi:putrescine aminotransferase